MARMLFMVMLAVMLIFTFQFIITGMNTPLQQTGDILNVTSGEMTTSEFFNNLFDISTGTLITLVLAAAGVITVGFFARAQLENFLVLGFITAVLLGLVATFTAIMGWTGDANLFSENWQWAGTIIKIFMGLFIVAYIVTMVEFFRGNI